MSKRKNLFLLAMAATASWVLVSATLAQTAPATEPAAAPKSKDEQRELKRKQREDFLKQSLDRMKEPLGSNDEEWKILKPKIEKVQSLRWLDDESDVAEARIALSKLAFDKGAKTPDVKAAIDAFHEAKAAYREACAKVQSELGAAQRELKEILTVKQEAYLIIIGLLD